MALPRLSGFLSFLLFLFTAAAIAFLPPDARNDAALAFDRHLGLPSPFFLSPHLPILSPLVLYLSQPPPPPQPFLPLPNHERSQLIRRTAIYSLQLHIILSSSNRFPVVWIPKLSQMRHYKISSLTFHTVGTRLPNRFGSFTHVTFPTSSAFINQCIDHSWIYCTVFHFCYHIICITMIIVDTSFVGVLHIMDSSCQMINFS